MKAVSIFKLMTTGLFIILFLAMPMRSGNMRPLIEAAAAALNSPSD